MEKLTPSVWSYVTSLLVGIFSMSVSELVAVGGLILAILTFLVNWFYKHRNYQLMKERK